MKKVIAFIIIGDLLILAGAFMLGKWYGGRTTEAVGAWRSNATWDGL